MLGRTIPLALVLLIAGGCSHVIRAYDGPRLDAKDEVLVYETDELYLAAVDNTPISTYRARAHQNPRPPYPWHPGVYALAPGDHRITVRFLKDGDPNLGESLNPVTFRHVFRAGDRVTFDTRVVDAPRAPQHGAQRVGSWLPRLVDRSTYAILEDQEGRGSLRTPAVPHEGFVSPQNPAPPPPHAFLPPKKPITPTPGLPPSESGTMVAGTATLRRQDGLVVTAAGRWVLLVPRTPEVLDWIAARRQATDNKHSPPAPAVVAARGLRVLGYGDGEFAFTGVQPGEYVLVFPATGNAAGVASAEVSVRPGQPRTPDAVLTANAPTWRGEE
jgi:hypothetical protein